MTGWLGIIGPLAGVVIGGGVTYFVNKWRFEQERAERQRIAAMQVAAQLQAWLIQTVRAFADHPVFYQPDPDEAPGDPYGYYFPTPSDIPVFPFANDLDRIAQLPSADAEMVFGLVQKKASAEREAAIAAELVDHERAADVFEPLIAQAWLDSLAVYQKLAARLKWRRDVVAADALADMRQRAAPKPAAAASADTAAIP